MNCIVAMFDGIHHHRIHYFQERYKGFLVEYVADIRYFGVETAGLLVDIDRSHVFVFFEQFDKARSHEPQTPYNSCLFHVSSHL